MPARAATSPARVRRTPWTEADEIKLRALWKQQPIQQDASDAEYWQTTAKALGTGRTPEAVRQRWLTMCRVESTARPSAWTRLQRTSVPRDWRPLAYQHSFYLMSSTFYGVSGLALGYMERGKPRSIAGEPIIWVIQTLLTHKSDVVTLGEDSIWHGLDRLHAYTFTILRAAFTWYAYWVWEAYSNVQAAIFLCGLAMALACIRLSWMAVMRRDAAAFFRWHSLWHLMLPATALCVGLLA
jgi:hypothetical protein